MFNDLRGFIGVRAAQFHFRKLRDSVVSFTSAVSGARQVLIIMPLGPGEFLPTVMVIDMLKRRFREENLTIVTGDRGLEVMRMLPRTQFIHLLKHEVSYFFLPRADVIERLRKRQYDLAIDLNLDLVLPSAYICRASAARVRIGFNRKHADAFYNFQIQPDPTLSKRLIYDRLVQCLDMF